MAERFIAVGIIYNSPVLIYSLCGHTHIINGIDALEIHPRWVRGERQSGLQAVLV